MKKKIFFGLGMSAFLLASCGGSGEETTDSAEAVDSTEIVEDVIEPVTYTIDTTTTEIHWTSYDKGAVDHTGTVKALSGTVTVEGDVITTASMEINMNTIKTDEGSQKLENHLSSEDFFNVANFLSSSFTMDRHEEGVVYGTVKVIGLDLAVEAPVDVVSDENGSTVTTQEFKLNMSQLPFYVEDVNAPEEEQHDPMIGITAVVKAVK